VYVAVLGTVQYCIPLVTLKKAVLFFQASTPVPVSPVLAASRLGPSLPVVPPGVKVIALLNSYRPVLIMPGTLVTNTGVLYAVLDASTINDNSFVLTIV
jgi:hypothetical protein